MKKKFEFTNEDLKIIEQDRKDKNNKREDKRLEAIELRIKGYTIDEIQESVEVNIRTIKRWIKSYKVDGIGSILDKKDWGIIEI